MICAPDELLDDPPAVENEDPVADRRQLLVIGACAERRRALFPRIRYHGKHLRPRADVDALGRLIEQDQPRPGLKPFRQEHLLLIAAAQRSKQRLRVAGTHVEAIGQVGGVARQGCVRQAPKRGSHAPAPAG